MPEEQGKPEANKPEPNNEQQVTQGQPEKQKQQAQPNTPSNTTNSAGANAGVTVAQAREADVAEQQPKGPTGVAKQHAADAAEQQKTPATAESQTGGVVGGLLGLLGLSVSSALPVVSRGGGGSVVVNCRYCPGGCCGGLSGHRLSVDEVELVKAVKVLFGFRYECEVLNRWPELFCRRRGRGRSVKELERLLSRELEYKAGYVFGRLAECRNDAVCVQFLKLGVEGWFKAAHEFAGRVPGDAGAYVSKLVRGLGFGSVVEASRYLRLVVQGLVEFNYVNRGRGYRDVLSVRCRICGRVIDATGPLPAVLFNIVRHFRAVHGLAGPGDVEAKVRELEGRGAERPEGDDTGIKLLRHSGEVTQLIRLVVHRLVERGLLERFGREYRCRACNADIGSSVEALSHVMNHHYGAVDKLLAKSNDAHPSECRPEDIGATPDADPSNIIIRLACELFKRYGKPGQYVALAETLLKNIKNGCSERKLEKLGYGNVKLILEALKALKLC
ncbi:MAG: hypothetical protein RXQ94_04240 [Caldivirga sp.]